MYESFEITSVVVLRENELIVVKFTYAFFLSAARAIVLKVKNQKSFDTLKLFKLASEASGMQH